MTLTDLVQMRLDANQAEYRREQVKSGVTSFFFPMGDFVCHFGINEPNEQIHTHIWMEQETPRERLWEVMKFVTRASRGYSMVTFDYDCDNGAVQCRAGFDVEGTQPSPQMIDNLILLPFKTAEKYYPGLQKVISGTSADDAIRMIEG